MKRSAATANDEEVMKRSAATANDVIFSGRDEEGQVMKRSAATANDVNIFRGLIEDLTDLLWNSYNISYNTDNDLCGYDSIYHTVKVRIFYDPTLGSNEWSTDYRYEDDPDDIDIWLFLCPEQYRHIANTHDIVGKYHTECLPHVKVHRNQTCRECRFVHRCFDVREKCIIWHLRPEMDRKNDKCECTSPALV
jgi:hypothetical protein